MIEWAYYDTSHTYLGTLGGEEVAEIYGKDANYMSFWSVEQGTFITIEAAKAKAESMLAEWLSKIDHPDTEKLGMAVELLKDLQWAGTDNFGGSHCPICYHNPDGKHTSKCELFKLISEQEPK